MSKERALRLGIVGGLGALAGADLLSRIVQETPVKSEGDHRELVFEQRPMREPVPPMHPDYSPTHRKLHVFDTLSRLERDGCAAALLPCFVTHSFLSELEDELNLKLISMMDAIKDAIAQLNPRPTRIGVLTTPFVRNSKLFQALFGEDINVLFPAEKAEAEVMRVMYGENGFKSGRTGQDILTPIKEALFDLSKQGATAFVPGMSELPLLLERLEIPASITAMNSATIYAKHALKITEANRKRSFKVGVVGGIGPAATVDFMSKLVNRTDATRDQDHIKVLVEQNPQIPDRTENLIGGGTDPTIALYSTCKKLERGGANILAIPCNTAHAYTDCIQRNLDAPIVSILSATTDHIRKFSPDIQTVGILATSGTIQSNLYQQALEEANL